MIKMEGVSKSYSTGTPALNNVSLHIRKGEFVFIVGDVLVLLQPLVPECRFKTLFTFSDGNLRNSNPRLCVDVVNGFVTFIHIASLLCDR